MSYTIQSQTHTMEFIRNRGIIKRFDTIEDAISHIKHQCKLGIYKLISDNYLKENEIIVKTDDTLGKWERMQFFDLFEKLGDKFIERRMR